MKITTINKLSLIACLCLISITCFGQFKDSKVYSESSGFSQTGTVSITSVHGAINIVSWEKDSIRVSATVSGESRSMVKLQEAMAKTNVNISLTNNRADIYTQISANVLEKGISEIKKISGSDNTVSINYTVYLPKSANLMLSNRFGDIFLDNHMGTINLDINHGSVRANDIPKLQQVKSNFGDIYIGNTGSINAYLQFTELDIDEMDKMIVNSKGGTLQIGQIKNATINSTNDKIFIDKITDIQLNSNLSKIKIGSVTNSGTLNVRYGRTKVTRISSDACNFTFTANRSTVDLGFASNSSFKIIGSIIDGELQTTNPKAKITNTNGALMGYIGDENAACSISINGTKSKIYLR